MAKRVSKKQARVKPEPVLCSQCKAAERDTEGINFRMSTGEFFMGTCHKGKGLGKKSKVFMDSPKFCNAFEKKK